MSRFPQYLRRQLAYTDKQVVDRAVRDTPAETTHAPGATAPGDPRRLRGIPAIGPNVQGAIPGTRPEDCLR